MPVIVVGGSGKDVGKTTLVCGVLAALPEFRWTAVKITSHDYGQAEPLVEEMAAGHETDTQRFLGAGAARAFLISAGEDELARSVDALRECVGPEAALIFESNRVIELIRPDICLVVVGSAGAIPKASFDAITHRMDAKVVRADRDALIADATPEFQLADLGQLSQTMTAWVRERLQRD